MSNCQDGCQTNSRRYNDLLSTDRVGLSNTYRVIVLVWLGAVRSDTHSISWASCLLLLLLLQLFCGPLDFVWDYWVSQYQISKTSLDFTEAKDSEWQWHQLGHMQICTALLTDNHASTHHCFFTRCPFSCQTNSVKALKANLLTRTKID